MHRTVVYPNGMVEVFHDDEACDPEVQGCGVEPEARDPVADAIDLLYAVYENHGAAIVALDVLNAVHSSELERDAEAVDRRLFESA